MPQSAAAQARLQVDKVITHVNGRKVTTPAEFNQAMAAAPAGAKIELTLIGPDKSIEKVTLENK